MPGSSNSTDCCRRPATGDRAERLDLLNTVEPEGTAGGGGDGDATGPEGNGDEAR